MFHVFIFFLDLCALTAPFSVDSFQFYNFTFIHLEKKHLSYTFYQFVTSLRLTILFDPKENLNLAHLFLTRVIWDCDSQHYEKPCFSFSDPFTYYFSLFIIHLPPSLFLSISAHLLFLACWFLYAPNVLYLPMHSVSIHWAAEGMHLG